MLGGAENISTSRATSTPYTIGDSRSIDAATEGLSDVVVGLDDAGEAGPLLLLPLMLPSLEPGLKRLVSSGARGSL